MVDLNEIDGFQETLNNLREQVEAEAFQRELLEEKLSGVDLQLDNLGWSDVYGYTDDGPDLSDVKAISKQVRNATARNVWVKNGWKLRFNYVFAGGVRYANLPEKPSRGREPDSLRAIKDPVNQANFFGPAAWERCEGSLYTDGVALYVGSEENSKKRISELPLNQVTGVYCNPDDPSEVWAYRREWTRRQQNGQGVEMKEWIFRDLFWDKKVATITVDGQPEPVSKTKRVFGGVVNDLPGWSWGVPDAFSGLAWARQYKDALLNGKSMSDAMATIAYQITSPKKAGAAQAGVRMSSARSGGGGTATMVEGQQMQAMTTAGRSYDYDSSRPLLAAMAAGIGVSVIALSSDPGAAGSSYGSASTLDLPTQLMAEARREFHKDLHESVLAWMGAPDVEVWFEPLKDANETLREFQAAIIRWNTGLYEAADIRKDLESILGRVEDENPDIPEGVLLPNNRESWERTDIDPNEAPGSDSGAPGQGQSTGAGDAPTNNDGRTDTIS